ncbi:MerR family transcriptional regulator [Paenibacillus sp. FSL R7-0048]|uniref:MerR family transcriptional regulator n=1 Tax=Paenibacillus sp. FSL R7-0048 TaxID=2954528 RepID=UPI0030F4EBDE
MLGTKEISEILGVKAVTVRKYAGELEKAGYSVTKSESGHREYSEDDATAFRHMKALCEQSGMTVELAAKVVAAKHFKAHESVAPMVVSADNQVSERYEERYNELFAVMQQLGEQNQQQAAELDRLHKRMDEQNANISVILREVLETRRLVAATSARKWWKFWDKEIHDEPDPKAVWNKKQNPENYLK